MAAALLSAGVPTPPTFVGRIADLVARVPAAHYPLVVKPVLGDNCRGLAVVANPGELAALPWHEPVALAQRLVPGDGVDLKLYGIGEALWAVRKPSPFALTCPPGPPSDARLVPLTPVLRRLGRRCRHLFGLDLFGVDCLDTPAGPVVIEVNDFPNYTAVPDASDALADHVASRIEREAAA